MHSRVSPGGAWGTIWESQDKSWVDCTYVRQVFYLLAVLWLLRLQDCVGSSCQPVSGFAFIPLTGSPQGPGEELRVGEWPPWQSTWLESSVPWTQDLLMCTCAGVCTCLVPVLWAILETVFTLSPSRSWPRSWAHTVPTPYVPYMPYTATVPSQGEPYHTCSLGVW